MKTFKKIGFGLVLAIAFVGIGLASPKKAAAAGPAVTVRSDFTFVNKSTITGSINGATVTFYDKDVTDPNYNYAPKQGLNTSTFCNSANWGITLPSGTDFTAPSITGTISLGYNVILGQNKSCPQVPATNYTPSNNITIDNSSGNASATYKWNSDGTIVGVNGGPTYSAATGSGNTVYIDGIQNGSCGSSGAIVSDGSGGWSLYNLISGVLRIIPSPVPLDSSIAQYISGSCRVAQGYPKSITIAGIPPQGTANSCTDISCRNTSGAGAAITTPPGSTSASCASNFDTGFEWVLCPALDMADKTAGVLNNFVEQQMCFNTGNSSSTNGGVPVCPGKNNLTSGVRQSWSLIKNIASGLLVIILLIVIIVQALGGGGLEAYTIRKMLPRIIAAVILMQISWYLFKWAIDLSNDIGFGIRDILFAPFGGGDKLQLDSIIGAKFGTLTKGTNDTFALFGALALIGGAVIVSIPGLALLALYVVIALLTAFVVFVFRKLLIILLMILAPVALVLWILPGTERYWKMWSDNFTKLLLMFPIIMGLIAAGRIFAYITGNNNSATTTFVPHLAVAHIGPLPIPYFSSVTNFVDLFIIIFAYFGPYFLLPKAFQWGGAAMGMIGKGTQAFMERGAKPAKDYLQWRQGLSPWKQARAARKAEVERRSKVGFAEGLASGGLRGRYRRARLGGVGTPDAERRLRGRIVQSAEAEIEKQRKEDEHRALVQLMQRDLPQFHPDDQDNVREAIATGKTMSVRRRDGTVVNFDGAQYGREHEHGQRAALDRALVHGQMGVVDQYYTEAMNSGDAHRIGEATRFKDDNAEALGRRLTHVVKGYGVAVQATSGEIAQQSGHEVESIIAEYSTRAAAGDAAAQTALDGYIARHQEAVANPALGGSVDLRGRAAVGAYLEVRTAPPVPPGAPVPPALAHALDVIDGINHGLPGAAAAGTDREANRTRYQTPDLPPNQTIPLIIP